MITPWNMIIILEKFQIEINGREGCGWGGGMWGMGGGVGMGGMLYCDDN